MGTVGTHTEFLEVLFEHPEESQVVAARLVHQQVSVDFKDSLNATDVECPCLVCHL